MEWRWGGWEVWGAGVRGGCGVNGWRWKVCHLIRMSGVGGGREYSRMMVEDSLYVFRVFVFSY